MEKKLGYYSVLASLITSIVAAAIFYIAAAQKAHGNAMYTAADIYGGTAFVCLLSIIVSASIWPNAMERYMRRRKP